MTIKKKKKNAKKLEEATDLRMLKSDHHFFRKEFPEYFWSKCVCREKGCSVTVKKLQGRVEWADIWIQKREERTDYPQFDTDMLIDEAFNHLSNTQLSKWKDCQEKRLQIHQATSEKVKDANNQHLQSSPGEGSTAG